MITSEHVEAFAARNPHMQIIVDEKNITIQKPWGCDDSKLVIPLNNDNYIDIMNNVNIKPAFDALFHMDNNVIEFIFGFISEKDKIYRDYFNRSFVLEYEKQKIYAYYGDPSERLYLIADSFNRIPAEDRITVQQIDDFQLFRSISIDFQNPIDGEAVNSIKEYFSDKKPLSFYLRFERDIKGIDLLRISRNLNFLMKSFDRESPEIIVREETEYKKEPFKNIRYIKNDFPKSLIMKNYDETILKLIDIACHTNARDAFLYFYQVLEYAGFYYMDDKSKKALLRLLRDPSIISCCEDRLDEFSLILSDSNCSDDIRIKKVIEEYCDPNELWLEIDNDKQFFVASKKFEGGYELPGLISSDLSCEGWKTMWMPKLFDHITKIRNCIVHARERRESKVILPTKKNSAILRHYVPLMERIAREIAYNV